MIELCIEELKKELYMCYFKDLCNPKVQDNWSDMNRSFETSAIISLIVNDYFGGELCKTYVGNMNYYFNLIK